MENFSLYTPIIYVIVSLILAALITFTTTPIVRVLAFKIGAVDVPKDERRMHKKPMPRLGGLAIFLGFFLTTLVFCDYSPTMLAIWFGGLLIVIVGILDDVFRLNAFVKLAVQIVAAGLAVWQGLTIEFINFFGTYYTLGWLEIPVTVIWIIGLTNALNLIDGLDGLSCGVSAISSLSLLLVTLTLAGNLSSSLLMAILAGSCLGFLPFNSNPAKIFMGDTGALFLGYTLALLSIDGVFKLHAVLSFMIPLSIFGVPLFDTTFAIVRRLIKGQNPFTTPDRGHLHHRLIDMGFNQKQSVRILYAICGILGISAFMFTSENLVRAAFVILIGFMIFGINFCIVKTPATRSQAGLDLPEMPASGESDKDKHNE